MRALIRYFAIVLALCGFNQAFASGDASTRKYTDPAVGDYFLDAENGDDNNDGRSPGSAWQSLNRLDAVKFRPGEVILFKAGNVFTGSLVIEGGGTRDKPVVFGAYGKGPKPKLMGGKGNVEVIYIGGNGGLEFRDLQISNYHPKSFIGDRYGIRIVAPAGSGDIKQLHFHGLDFTDIAGFGSEHESRGIDAEIEKNDRKKPYTRWNGFIIENCFFSNIDGRAVQVNDRCLSLTDNKVRGTDYYPTTGFLFQNNTGLNVYRNLLQLSGTIDAVIQHNYMSGTIKGSAFWPFDAEGTLVQFNDFRHLRNASSDAFVCHFDYNCINTVMQYNFGYDVDGGLIEIIVNSEKSGFQEDAVARYNVGVDVGFRDKPNSAGIFLTGRVTRSKVYNNTIVFTDLHPVYKALSVQDWGGEWPDNNELFNNLFYAMGNRVRFNHSPRLAQLGNVLSNNLYFGNMRVPPQDLSPVNADPLLVNPGGLNPDDMKLMSGSPAIASGRMIAENGGRDFFNNPVPADLVPSIGFHEFQTDQSTPILTHEEFLEDNRQRMERKSRGEIVFGPVSYRYEIWTKVREEQISRELERHNASSKDL